MAGVSEAAIADVAGADDLRLARRFGDRCGASEGAQVVGGGEPGSVVTDLAEDTGREDRAETGSGVMIAASAC